MLCLPINEKFGSYIPACFKSHVHHHLASDNSVIPSRISIYYVANGIVLSGAAEVYKLLILCVFLN